jgi:hypothetical protein
MTESWPRLFSALAGRGSATAEAGLRLAADGNPREVPRLSADLPLINTSDRPVRRGRVGFSGDAAKLEAAHGLTVTHAGPGDWRFEADAPVHPGEARSIRMICPDGRDALASARWCE